MLLGKAEHRPRNQADRADILHRPRRCQNYGKHMFANGCTGPSQARCSKAHITDHVTYHVTLLDVVLSITKDDILSRVCAGVVECASDSDDEPAHPKATAAKAKVVKKSAAEPASNSANWEH
jgi:hypothetical protein